MSRTYRNGWLAFGVTMIAGTIAACAMGMQAFAQTVAASQPVIVPAPSWLAQNAWWAVPLAVSLLSSVVTGLSSYPKAEGAVKVLRIIVGCLSVVSFKDAPGSLKAPFAPPAAPKV